MGLPNKKNSPSSICSKIKNGLWFDALSIAEPFKKTLLLISGKPCVETTKPPNNFGIQLVNNYYSKFKLKEGLLFAKIESDEVIKILKTFDETKAPDIDDLSEIFLKRVQHY